MPSPCHALRCGWGDVRNQCRRTTSRYISAWIVLSVLAKVFFSSDSATTSPRLPKIPSRSLRS